MSRKIYITEEQEKLLMHEMAYPSSFNFDEFSQLKSFAQQVKYCEARLKRLSSGSSRIVYLVDGDKVLKLAKNKKGVAQNKTEIRLSDCPYYTCFAPVYNYDPDGLWCEMEYCYKAIKSEFKRLYGVPFEALCCFILDLKGPYNIFSEYREIVDQVWENGDTDTQDLFNAVHDYIANEGLNVVLDLCRLSSWGITSDGCFVIVDYGLDNENYETFYKRR